MTSRPDKDEVLNYAGWDGAWLDLEDLIEGTGLPGADRRRYLGRHVPGDALDLPVRDATGSPSLVLDEGKG